MNAIYKHFRGCGITTAARNCTNNTNESIGSNCTKYTICLYGGERKKSVPAAAAGFISLSGEERTAEAGARENN